MQAWRAAAAPGSVAGRTMRTAEASASTWSMSTFTWCSWQMETMRALSGPSSDPRAGRGTAAATACPSCQAPLTVVRTPEGFIDVMCPNCKSESLTAHPWRRDHEALPGASEKSGATKGFTAAA